MKTYLNLYICRFNIDYEHVLTTWLSYPRWLFPGYNQYSCPLSQSPVSTQSGFKHESAVGNYCTTGARCLHKDNYRLHALNYCFYMRMATMKAKIDGIYIKMIHILYISYKLGTNDSNSRNWILPKGYCISWNMITIGYSITTKLTFFLDDCFLGIASRPTCAHCVVL